MRDRGVATRYARALVESAKAESVLAEVAESYEAVLEVVAANPDLPAFLEGPQVAESEKKELLNTLFGGRIEQVLIHFFHLLTDKNRIEYLQEIGAEYATMVEKEQGYTRAYVTTAVSLPADLELRLRKKLAQLTSSQIILQKSVDPGVLGGVTVTFGDNIIDGTVRTNLELLRKQLVQTSVRLSE